MSNNYYNNFLPKGKTVSEKYSSAVESFENLIRFHNPDKQVFNDSLILESLNKCLSEIEQLINLETDDQIIPIALFHLKQQLQTFILIIQDKNMDHKKSFICNLIRPQVSGLNLSRERKNDILANIESTIEIPRVSGLNAIAGLWEMKRILKSLIILPKHQPQLFENRKRCNSLLLFGPPGTGKTLIVHAIAAEASAILHSISVSDILSSYVGESEKMIKSLFQFIKSNGKYTILFIDEIDGFCRKRKETEQEFSRRLKTEIMCQLSAIENHSNIFIICATNCPWDLDAAIIRRFHKRLFIPLPNQEERLELFKLFTRGTLENIAASEWLPLLTETKGLSGSDIADFVQNAMDVPINELQQTKIWRRCIDGFYEPVQNLSDDNFADVECASLEELPPNSVRARPFCLSDLMIEAEKCTPTVFKEDLKRFENFNKQ